MKETFYFSHDYNARNDEKIIKLISKEGLEGYGIFWMLIEKLYEADGYLNNDYDCIAFDIRTSCERIKNVIENYNLFIIDLEDNNFYSQSVLNRLDKRKEKSEKAKESADKRWNNREKDANALPTQSEPNAIKESKVKEIKDINSEETSPNLKDLYSSMGLPPKVKIAANKWQEEAANALKYFIDGESKDSSIFKCFKDNNQKARLALSDCKELGKTSVLYFLKVYNEIKK